MEQLKIRRGDYGYYIKFTQLDSTGVNPYNLGLSIPYLNVWTQGSPTQILLHAPGETVNPQAGTWRYLVKKEDFLMPGIYHAELEYILSDSCESSETFLLVVEESP